MFPLNNATALHHQNLIGATNCGQPMSDHESRSAAHQVAQTLPESVLPIPSRDWRSAFIRVRNSRIGEDRPAMKLAASDLRRAYSTCSDNRVVFLVECFGELVDTCDTTGSSENLRLGCLRTENASIFRVSCHRTGTFPAERRPTVRGRFGRTFERSTPSTAPCPS